MKKPYARSILLAAVFSLYASISTAQTEHAGGSVWQDFIGSVLEESDDEADSWEDTYDILQELESSPIDINSATREDLERIPFLDDNNIQQLLEYVYRNGKMLSKAELAMIPSLSAAKRTLLQYFITIGKTEDKGFPTLKNLLKYGSNELTASVNLPLYDRKGDKNGYLGYKYKHNIRYEYSYSNYLRIGLLGAQDAGEPFFSGKNSAGYDFYSFYADMRKMGRIKALTIGRYRIGMGMGLIMNNSLSFGKTVSQAALTRRGATVRPHSSRSSYNYMQGIASTVSVADNVDVTAFLSYKDFDATLNKADGTIATILRSGYHRTETEMAKKNNTSQFAAGGNVTLLLKRFHVGVSALYASLNRRLNPDTSQKYRRYYAAGKRFYNMSVDYGYTNGRFSFHGETATGDSRAVATVNAAMWRMRSNLSLAAIQRFYSYKYYSLFSQSFSDGGSVQNESGMYVGLSWQPLKALSFDCYSDLVYYPWAKYQISAASHSFDNMLSATYSKGAFTLSVRYRLKTREKDNEKKTALINQTTQRGRIAAGYARKTWSVKTQFDTSLSDYKERSFGYMASVSGGCSAVKKLKAYANLGYFHTRDYSSRIYSYERGMAYDFAFPSFYGEGIHYALMLSADMLKNLTATVKLSTTDYFDRSAIGTGLQAIDRSSMTDIQIQARWRF